MRLGRGFATLLDQSPECRVVEVINVRCGLLFSLIQIDTFSEGLRLHSLSACRQQK